jgi:hypothetical protein
VPIGGARSPFKREFELKYSSFFAVARSYSTLPAEELVAPANYFLATAIHYLNKIKHGFFSAPSQQ